MVRALENLCFDPTYLEFFGLTRPPFARLSRPSEVFQTEQYSLLMAHLANATQQSDCLVVICGASGSGKTTLLNLYISSLGDDISFATIDDTCNGEKQFYCAFLKQLGFGDISGTTRELQRITKKYLIVRGMSGDPVLMIFDNAHLMNPIVLEQLRWISAIKVGDRRVLSIVLTGTSDLVRIMDSPAMSQVKFRNHIDFKIRIYTEEETASYIRHRLKLAGGIDVVKFSNAAHPLIYRYTSGIPSLINMLCNAILTEACTLESRVITDDLVRTVADDRRLLPHVIPLRGKGRRKSDPDFELARPDPLAWERITARDTTTQEAAERPKSSSDISVCDVDNLLEQISLLSEQLFKLEGYKERACQEIRTRDRKITELGEKLDAQTSENEKLAAALVVNTGEIGRMNQALSDSAKACQKSDNEILKIARDLETERSAAKTAQREIAEAKATVEELSCLKSELQATVKNLTADLEPAKAREVEIEKMTGELDALRSRAAALETLEESIAKKDVRIADLKDELATYLQEITALEAKNEELESRDLELTDAEAAIAELKSKLREAEQSLTETQVQLEENSKLIVQLDAGNRLTASSGKSRPVSDGEHPGALTTAFEVVKDGNIERTVEIAEGQSRFMIGRGDDSELFLDSKFVSRHHALIFRTITGLYIEDLNSSNGTIVNSRRITRCDLRDGDLVTIGDYDIWIRQA